MLLASLGADVIKVESPIGDAYRHYEPLGDNESTRFYALNQGKRSVVCDLKTAEGRAFSDKLIASADVVVHNMPHVRAVSFGLDSDAIRRTNSAAVVAVVTAFGSDGPKSGQVGYDLIAQAYSGLLMADADPGDRVPRRSGGIPFSDITSGLLACISVLAGLTKWSSRASEHFEVSLLSASLLTQIQDFVRLENAPHSGAASHGIADRSDLSAVSEAVRSAAELEPYYRCYEASDGFFALACLTTSQREKVLEVLGLKDPWVANPQSPPINETEREVRVALAHSFARQFREAPANQWIERFALVAVPAGEVRLLTQLFDDEQVKANGLVRRHQQSRGGSVDVYGTPFKINGTPSLTERPAPRLGQHNSELQEELSELEEYAK
jgi:crotonobetainyl-CoA:carnitine CoA-transferase CaiB-like acyl-CoA transferase